MMHLLLNAVLYFLSGFVPRNHRKLIFGAWMGKKVADNPKYFAMYLANCKPGCDLVWIGEEACREFIPKGLPIRFILRESIRSWWEMLTASACFVSHGIGDICGFNLMRGATRVYLGHGLAIKHMYSKDQPLNSRLLSAIRRLLRQSYSFQFYVASSGEHRQKLLDESVTWNIRADHILNSGQPRVDFLIAHSNDKSAADMRSAFLAAHGIPHTCRVVTYLPTWRDKEASVFSFASLGPDRQARLQGLLASENAVLLEKPHLADLMRGLGEHQLKEQRVFSIGGSRGIDTQELLLITDLLITDYSGCYVDFLVLNRPIIHFAYDRENYEHADRGLYFDLDRVAGGAIVKDFETLCVVMQQYLRDSTIDEDQRLRTRAMLAEFEQGTACQQLAGIVSRSNRRS